MTASQYPDPLVPAEVDDKRFATLKARAALAGYELRTDPLGAFYATRWGYMTMLESLDEAEAWIQRVSGKKQPTAWEAYEAGKAEFLAANPQASADEIEEHAKRLARKEGL